MGSPSSSYGGHPNNHPIRPMNASRVGDSGGLRHGDEARRDYLLVMETTPERRLVVATDFSETADRALAAAIDLARSLSAQIVLVHVYAPVMVLPPPLDMVSLPAVFPNLMPKMEAAIDARAARVHDAGLACEVELIEGNPQVEICRYAETVQAELIVLGTHGRSGLYHAVLGSVAERVIHRSTRPVLVIPDRRK
jgi:nucleotide-binding universal stress UspA family protein